MSKPVEEESGLEQGRASPAASESDRPHYRFPEDAFPPEVRRQLAKEEHDPVDVQAALQWLNGEGPNPWTEGSR